MKILYVAGRRDPLNHDEGSGTDYEIYHSLLRFNPEINISGPYNYKYSFFQRILMRVHNLFYKTRLAKYPFQYFPLSGREVTKDIKTYKPDVIITKYAAPILFVNTDIPILYICDSTAKWVNAEWKIFSTFSYYAMLIWEKIVLQKVNKIITFSHENAKIIINSYKIAEDKVMVYPIPASIPDHLLPKIVNISKSFKTINLLIVGKEFERKGMDIAINTVNQLNKLGKKAQLRIVGLDGINDEHVFYMGLYSKTKEDQLIDYIQNYKWAHFLLHPARFEAAGIVPGEAAALGVPTITNDSGGLATTVEHNVSGIVLPKHSSADRYVEIILGYIENQESYWQLVASTKNRYDTILNWQSFGKVIFDELNHLIN